MRFHTKLFLCLVSLGSLVRASDARIRRQDVATTSMLDTHVTNINTLSKPTATGPTATTGPPAVSTSMIDTNSDIASSAEPTSASSSQNSTSGTFDGKGLPLEPSITPAIAIAGVVLLITGAAYNLIGIKNLWVHVSLSAAFLTSLSITVLIEYVMSPPVSNGIQGAYFVAAFFTGLVFGGISLVFKEVTEGLGCLLGGFCLSMWFLSLKDGGLLTSSTARGAFIGSFCVVAYAFSFTSYTRAYALIASTAFAGSTAAILGIDCFSRAGLKEFWLYNWGLNDDIFPLNTTTYPLTKGIRVELAAIIVVCLLGLLSQLRLWKVIRERRQKQEAKQAEEQQKRDEAELELGRTIEEKKMHELARWEAVYGGEQQSTKRGSKATESSVTFTPGLQRTHSAPDLFRKGSEAGVEMVTLSVQDGKWGSSVGGKYEENAKGTNVIDEGKEHKETDGLQQAEKPEAGDEAEYTAGEENENVNEETEKTPPIRVPTPLQCVQSPPFNIPNPDDKGQEDDRHSIQAIIDDGDSIANRLSRRLSGVSILQRLSQKTSTHRNSRQITSDSEEMLVPKSPSSPASSVQGISDDISFEMQDIEPDTSKEPTPSEQHLELATEDHTATEHKDPQTQTGQKTTIGNSAEKETVQEKSLERPHGLGLSSTEHRNTFNGGSSPFIETVTPAPAASVDPSIADTGSGKDKSATSPRHSQHAQLRPQPSSNSRSSVSKRGSLTAGAVEHLPSHVSPLITSYRTNEWAKHLSTADTPVLEDIELSPTLVNSDEETTAPVKLYELTQTATTAAPPLAINRRVSLPEKLDTIQRASSSVSKGSAQDAVPQRAPSVYIEKAAIHPANIHTASSRDLLRVNSARSTLSNVVTSGFRNSSTPFLGKSLVASPIDESQEMNYDSPPMEGPLPLMAQREKMVQSRLSSVSLSRHSWMPPRSQSRQTIEEDGRSPQDSQLSLTDDDDMPLTQRRSLLRQQSMSPANTTAKAEDPGRAAVELYPIGARLSRESRASTQQQSQSIKMAAWRESLQEDLIRSQTSLFDVDVARQGMMDQQRRAQIAKTQRALASENLNDSIAQRMRRGEMQDVHREAMRRMQAAANRKAQEDV